MASRIIAIGGLIILIIGLILLSWSIYVGVANNWSYVAALGWFTPIVPGSILTFIGFVLILYYLIKR